MKIHRLNDEGRRLYRAWLETRSNGEQPPQDLLNGPEYTEVAINVDIELDLAFVNRLEFGRYILTKLSSEDPHLLLGSSCDGVWDWITVAYFAQFGKKRSKYWHYTVTRTGTKGSLAYRHLARTAYEMYWRHQENSLVLLHVDMATGGEMAEQLTSRHNIAYHIGFIKTANELYIANGLLKRGAAARAKPLKTRKPRDTMGKGGAARLALAVRRLCRTYDTHALATDEMIQILPKEFSRFLS